MKDQSGIKHQSNKNVDI